jgi:hypothetical protein
MHFSFNLLIIKGLYMFRALLAHPHEALHKRNFVYCVRIVGETATVPQPTDSIRTQYTKCLLWSASWGWASNARNMYRPLIHNKLNETCITLVSLYWYTMIHGQQNIKYAYVNLCTFTSFPSFFRVFSIFFICSSYVIFLPLSSPFFRMLKRFM